MILSRFKRRPNDVPPVPSVPTGFRVYAVGDVHGRLDLLQDMIELIEADIATRGPAKNHLVMLGDLIDRGPDSHGVIERLRMHRSSDVELVVISGNHEEVLLRVLAGEKDLLDDWLTYGGSETIQSYGIDPRELNGISERAAIDLLRSSVPVEHRRFLEAGVDTLQMGDYLFVHAGIRPAIDLSLQKQKDLHWIRQPFLEYEGDYGFVIVHGHTISETVVERHNRIGLDTGAYATGRLSAVGLEGGSRWFLEAAR